MTGCSASRNRCDFEHLQHSKSSQPRFASFSAVYRRFACLLGRKLVPEHPLLNFGRARAPACEQRQCSGHSADAAVLTQLRTSAEASRWGNAPAAQGTANPGPPTQRDCRSSMRTCTSESYFLRLLCQQLRGSAPGLSTTLSRGVANVEEVGGAQDRCPLLGRMRQRDWMSHPFRPP